MKGIFYIYLRFFSLAPTTLLHTDVSTKVSLRKEINKSSGTYLEISEKFGVSENTVKK